MTVARLLITVLLGIIALLQYQSFAGTGGYAEQRVLKKQLVLQREVVALQTNRNSALAAEVADLKSGVDAVQAHARRDLGMVLPNETFFLITETP